MDFALLMQFAYQSRTPEFTVQVRVSRGEPEISARCPGLTATERIVRLGQELLARLWGSHSWALCSIGPGHEKVCCFSQRLGRRQW